MAKRRQKGEGSISQLPSGSFRIRMEVNPVNGKRKWITKTLKTRQEALRELRSLQVEKENDKIVEPLKETFKDFIDPFIAYEVAKGLRPTTLVNHRSYLKRPSVFFGSIPVQKITEDHMASYLLFCRKECKETAITPMNSVLRAYFSWLERKNIITKSPCIEVIKRKAVKEPILVLSLEEHKKLKKVMQDKWNPSRNFLVNKFYSLYCVAYETGMREGELAALKWSNVDTTNNMIRVDSNIIYANGLKESKPKTASGTRETYVTPETMSLLKELPRVSEYVWGRNDSLMYPNRILIIFKNFLKLAGIQRNIKFHTIRHTCASLMISKGVNPTIIAERLGHSNVSVTYQIYAHTLNNDDKKKVYIEA